MERSLSSCDRGSPYSADTSGGKERGAVEVGGVNAATLATAFTVRCAIEKSAYETTENFV